MKKIVIDVNGADAGILPVVIDSAAVDSTATVVKIMSMTHTSHSIIS